MKNTYKTILQEMSERTLKADTLEGDAQLFALLRQTACASGDLPAMADVDNAVLMAGGKSRLKNVVLKEATMPPAAYGRFMSTAMPEPLLAATLQRR